MFLARIQTCLQTLYRDLGSKGSNAIDVLHQSVIACAVIGPMHATEWLVAICLFGAANSVDGASQLPSEDVAVSARPLRWPRHCPQLLMPQHKHDAVTAADQEAAASALVDRLLPAEAASVFVFRIEEARYSRRAEGPHGGFIVVGSGESIIVTGGSGIDLSAGVYWFLKNRSVFCVRQEAHDALLHSGIAVMCMALSEREPLRTHSTALGMIADACGIGSVSADAIATCS